MDRQLLEKVISELSLLLPGGRVDRIYQNERGEIILVIVRGRKFFPLLLSPDKNLPRMHLVSRKPAARDGATDGFVLYLRSHLVRAAVAGVELAPDNRLTELSFSKNGKDYRLFFELFRPR